MTDATTPKIVEPEGGHFYSIRAELISTVPSADGKKQVKCTLRHARTMDLARGVTSVIGSCDKPALTRWKMEQVAIAACTLTRQEGESDESWQKRLLEEAGKTGKESAAEGTRIHKQIQNHFQLAPIDPDYQDHVDGATQELDQLNVDEWRSEVPCVSMLGYGTMADLVGYRRGEIVALVDTKTKDGSLEKIRSLGLYDEHYMQLAATCDALGVNPDHIAVGILFTSRDHRGSSAFVPAGFDELKYGMDLFRPLLRYTHTKDRYRPSWARD